MKLKIPELSLVVLVGASGSGKSTFGRDHFLPTEVISSDFCRGLVSDNENNQEATNDAFDVLHYIVGKRLARGRLTVVDATNVQPEARKSLIALARQYHCLPVTIVLNLPEDLCWARTTERPDRNFGRHVIRGHRKQLRRSLRHLKREGFRYVYELRSEEEVANAVVERQPLWTNRQDAHGPFDIIGDVHGCADELELLLEKLGYVQAGELEAYHHPDGRQALFVGDLVDRGPRILDSYQIARRMVEAGSGWCVPGNHDNKLLRKLNGRDVQITHGLDRTLAEIEALPDEIRESYVAELKQFLRSLVSHYVLDDGKLVVAHAGMREELQGRGSGKVRDFALYGETTGEIDEFGLPVRHNWASEYRGRAMVVYGHTPIPEPEWFNSTINVDTGCVFGGRLTALRYPEKELVSVPALQTYVEPAKPFLPEDHETPALSLQQHDDGLLRMEDVMGKRIITTRLRSSVTIREENSIAALEVMSRFAADPKWLIYLPPTMSPSETSKQEGLLEHPTEAFTYYRKQGVPKVVCEQKHMGSRAVVIVCRDETAAQTRFGVTSGEIGICYTRTGRRFFKDRALEAAFLTRLQTAVTAAGWWEKMETEWICLDCELMPWSLKAQSLLQEQYGAVGAAAQSGLSVAVEALRGGAAHNPDVAALLTRYETRQTLAADYVTAYGHYCWPVEGLDDLKLAPFHLLASENKVYSDQTHVWHMDTLAELCAQDDEMLLATPYMVVDVTDAESCQAGAQWWTEMTAAGGEGMVVKPLDFIVNGGVQPAVKSRGQEYLRIIYGPEYTMPENLTRLRARRLGGKRSLAMREFALGIESLERFVRREPLYRVHECVFGVLALESEPIDPRL